MNDISPQRLTEPPAILQARIEGKLVEELLEKALTRLEDIMDTSKDDTLVQKTATYIVDLAKEIAGFRGKDAPRGGGVNVAIFPPAYLTKMAGEARKVLDAEVIEVDLQETIPR
jgi:hypothetical protein